MARPRKAKARAKRRIAQRTARNSAAKQASAAQAEKPLERARVQPVLDRYLARDQIKKHQYEAGIKFYEHWLGMGGHGSITASYGETIRSHDHESPYQVRCYQAYRAAVQAVGKDLSPVLFAVCVLDETASEWARNHRPSAEDGMGILRLALDALAVHYGFMRPQQIFVAQGAAAVVREPANLAEVPVPA